MEMISDEWKTYDPDELLLDDEPDEEDEDEDDDDDEELDRELDEEDELEDELEDCLRSLERLDGFDCDERMLLSRDER